MLQTGEIKYFNQHNRVAGIAIGRCARTPRGIARREKNAENRKASEPPDIPEEIAEIERQILAESRRAIRHFTEEVKPGEKVPQGYAVRLRLPTSWLGMPASGATHYGGVHGDALRYRQRHADYHLNKQTGARLPGAPFNLTGEMLAWVEPMISGPSGLLGARTC